MFRIALFSFILLLFDDWRLAMQVNIHQSFFRQSFAAVFSPNFFTAKFFIVWYIILKISKFSIILSTCQPASQPPVRPGSTSAMALDFQTRKGNHV